MGTPIGSTTGTSGRTATGLANGTTYYFVMTVVAANGTMRAASAEVSAEPTGKAVLTSKEVSQRVIVSVERHGYRGHRRSFDSGRAAAAQAPAEVASARGAPVGGAGRA